MTNPPLAPHQPQDPGPGDSTVWPYIGVGCLTFFGGFFGGGMIAAFVAKVVGGLQRCRPENDLPACNLWSYVVPGALIGAVLLPTVAIWRLRGSRRNDDARRSQS